MNSGRKDGGRYGACDLVATAWIAGIVLGSISSLACHLPVRISKYQGDGTISRIKFLPSPGVKVDFEKFSLASPYKASYHLDGLPKHHSLYRVGLLPELPPWSQEERPNVLTSRAVGVLSLRLLDGTGGIIFDCRSTLDKLNWISSVDGAFGEINSPTSPRAKTSNFYFENLGTPPQVPSILEVSYEPAPDAPNVMARIQITAGGLG